MSKKGGSNHFVRMRASKGLGVVSRKKVKWLLAPAPGAHKKTESISAGVLMRDVLGIAQSAHEAKRILNTGNLLVDGRKVKDVKYSIGLMDIISLPAEKKSYRMSLEGAKLVPKEISSEHSSRKYLKVTGKHTIRGAKTQLSFHDGRTYLGDKNVKGILVNIFGGIMDCNVIAQGIVEAVREVGLKLPLVVRLEGNNVTAGKATLAASGLTLTSGDTMADAAQKIVKLVA